MKIYMRSVLAIVLTILCLGNANAKTDTSPKKCPAGLFCTSNGTYLLNGGTEDIPTYQRTPAELVTAGWGRWSDAGLCDKHPKSGNDATCRYYADDYDETWVSTWFGFYTIKNGKVNYHNMSGAKFSGVFPCPGSHPSSVSGASSVFECYTMVSGQKEYYKAPNNTQTAATNTSNNTEIKAIMADLQQSLDKTNRLAQELQFALNNVINEPLKAPATIKNKVGTDQPHQNEITINNETLKNHAITNNTSANVSESNTKNKPCNNKLHAGKGLFCASVITKECPKGCYCTGGGPVKWTEQEVINGCSTGLDKVTTELTDSGIHLCPAGTTSNPGATSAADCFKSNNVTNAKSATTPVVARSAVHNPANKRSAMQTNEQRQNSAAKRPTSNRSARPVSNIQNPLHRMMTNKINQKRQTQQKSGRTKSSNGRK